MSFRAMGTAFLENLRSVFLWCNKKKNVGMWPGFLENKHPSNTVGKQKAAIIIPVPDHPGFFPGENQHVLNLKKAVPIATAIHRPVSFF
ncbi:hypothetical protein ACFOTA_24175 [Chitinophaga sp. GCM10012297]|uniref:Uncharacterized protein n=1 Tax=Chitinophaga chungangae TaxID=2821488 RepID=A0ABS3YKU8_9BACT|nr:hypothetical protein [Chitinophaga chungangae]MBO9155330.1 hypothetical protein [Chitinophaga chungangae]